MMTRERSLYRLNVSWLLSRDYPAVVEIERLSFRQPWSESQFVQALRSQHVIAWVSSYGEQVVGYALYGVHQRHYHLLRFGTHPDCLRAGVASGLMDRLKGKLSEKRPLIVAEVPETCLSGQLFLRAKGFRATAVHRDWFGDEDGFEMEYRQDGVFSAGVDVRKGARA